MIIYNDKVFDPNDSSTFEQFTEEELNIFLPTLFSKELKQKTCK